jgi:hypothetical protein
VTTSSSAEVHGPIDFVLLEFPDQVPTGRAAAALGDLVDQQIIRLYDIVAIRKTVDGVVTVVEITDLDPDGFALFAGARSGLVDEGDVAEAASAMEPGTVAVLLIYENRWAAPFVAAARDAGGQLIASARIPAQDLIEALDGLEEQS